MGWLLKLLEWFLSLLGNRGPSPEAVQAAKAASADTSLQTEVKTNEKIQESAEAVNAVRRIIDSDSKLRDYERTDKNNRDND